MFKKTLFLMMVLVLVLGVAACGGKATPAPEPTAAPAAAAPTAAPAAAAPTAAPAAAEPTKAPEAAPAAGNVKELTIQWAQWDPANYLQEIGNLYEQETGIKINVVQEPWGSYANKVSAEWAARGTGFDMVVGDSQWIGQAVTEGHYVDMTDWLTSTGIKDTVTEATLKYYGEYPAGSGKYYAYPTEGDANGWAYRKDIVENPDEMKAFEAKYGYAYSIPPKDYNEFVDMSKFFYRPDANPPMYGAAVYTQKDYDAITMGFQNALFTYGCEWNKDWKVEDVLNAPHCVEALEAYKAMYDSGPPGNTNSFYPEMNNYFIAGQSTFAMNYFAFLPALANEGTDPDYFDKVGFFSNPPGPYGQQAASLGGQGTSINAYIDDERKQASFDFLKWFASDEIQMKWAELGGYTCNKGALASDAFMQAAPYNGAFAETMGFVKDFYNIPEYGLLLPPAQTALSQYVVESKGTAKEALDAIAAEHTKILTEAGYKPGAAAAPAAAEMPTVDKAKLGDVKELVIQWAQWDPANYLQEIGNLFEQETGVKITVVQEPWGSYANKVSAEWAARGTGFDMVVGDSQWIGQAVTEGHYVDMTDWLTSTGIKDTVTEATLKYYGEYPAGSGKYYAYPTEGDANGWAYRKDIVENPDEMKAFEAKYGYAYSIPPKDYNEFVDMSKFFYRPDANPPMYGAAVYTQKDYDAITMGFQNALFTYGCEWNKDWKVEDVLNAPHCVEALEAYKAMYDSGPPGNTNSFYPEMNNYFIAGQSTFAMNYFAFLPALANEGTDPDYFDKVGFFSNPPGPYGQQAASLGGQGTSINAYIDDERKQASFEFLKWFASDAVQQKWAELGGYTCNKGALATDAFMQAAPYNGAFAETMGFVKDFYNIPEYGLLLPPAQTALSQYVVESKGTAKEALDSIAAEHTKILTDAGYIK